MDVVSYLTQGLDLPFAEYSEGQPLPVKDRFDTVLLIAVLHHAEIPVDLLRKAWAATSKRLIIIESVVCVHQAAPGARTSYWMLPDDDQVGYAAFIDWFYNRCFA